MSNYKQYHLKLIKQMKIYERKFYVCTICKGIVKRSDKAKHMCVPNTDISIVGS